MDKTLNDKKMKCSVCGTNSIEITATDAFGLKSGRCSYCPSLFVDVPAKFKPPTRTTINIQFRNENEDEDDMKSKELPYSLLGVPIKYVNTNCFTGRHSKENISDE